MDRERRIDPICGMPVDPRTALSARTNGDEAYFCSELCRRELLRRPPDARALVGAARAARRFAYLSMEIAIHPRIPTYAGGLGVLAGDMLRSFADLRVPTVGVTLLYRKGYFEQSLDAAGTQRDAAASWSPEQILVERPERAAVRIEGRTVHLRIYELEIIGASGYVVPVLFLDTDLPENDCDDRGITGQLYGGDARYRLAQEIVLGMGGVRALRAAGYVGVRQYHMNEGHAALAAVELLCQAGPAPGGAFDFARMREQCVFTTHTPVAAGHDAFEWDLVRRVLGEPIPFDVMSMLAGRDRLDMTLLALDASHFVNGVARRHREVSEAMYPYAEIRQVTNGVHSVTWTCDSFRALFDECVPEWRESPAMLRRILGVAPEPIWRAHMDAKTRLLDAVRARTGRSLAPDILTVGFGRRATGYKRADLVFRDLERLRGIGRGRLQFVFGGKAHPRDGEGNDAIARVTSMARALGDDVPVVYLANYDLELAKDFVAGSDVWLNTPRRPLEASGTSGMKAAHNGVPSLSVLDGWWLEGCIEGTTGWSIGPQHMRAGSDVEDAADLYGKLEDLVMPTFYEHRERWIDVMRHAIALNASFFNTHRVVQQYVTSAYVGA